MHRVMRHALVTAAAAIMVAAAGACGAEPADDPAATAEPTPSGEGPQLTGDPLAPEEPTVITVAMIDNEFQVTETTLAAGTYTFVVEQHGQSPHALVIEGPGVSESTPEVPPGGEPQELLVTLEPGTYELWCPVANHRELGMETTIEVS